MLKMTAPEIEDFIATHFAGDRAKLAFKVEHAEEMFAQTRLHFKPKFLRHGGVIAGPTLMMLADTTMFVVILAMIGPETSTFTTNLNINFLRTTPAKDVIAKARLLKLGKRLAVGDVTMFSDGEAEPVAHATVTYSIPPKRK
ncbi:MAG: PaaI family thioesterase [Acidobacteriota bacterium]